MPTAAWPATWVSGKRRTRTGWPENPAAALRGKTMKIRMRTLRAGSREFKWTAEVCWYRDVKLEDRRCVRVRVWGGGKNGCMLLADLESTSSGPWGGVPDSSYPTPRDVRAITDYALEHGWGPAA